MQKGFINLSLRGYIVLGLGTIVLILGMLLKVQSSRLESCKAEHQRFVSEVERLGKEAQEKVKKQEAQDKLKKEKADAELKKLRSINADLSKRVRDSSNRSFLSSGETPTRIPESACLNAGAVDEALRKFARGAAELIVEGQDAVDSLNNARAWANPPSP